MPSLWTDLEASLAMLAALCLIAGAVGLVVDAMRARTTPPGFWAGLLAIALIVGSASAMVMLLVIVVKAALRGLLG